MSEIQTLELPPQEPLENQEISREQLGNYLAAIGNHEGKALLTIALANDVAPEKYNTQIELHRLLRALPGADRVPAGNPANQQDWCAHSLAGIGMVAKSDYANPIGYAATEECRRLGKPFAGLMLTIGDTYGRSLLQLSGTTHTRGGRRAPEVRLQIAETLLAQDGDIGIQALSKAVGMASVLDHIQGMAVNGLVSYDALDVGNYQPKYKLLEPGYKPNAKGQYTQLIVELLKQQPDATFAEITQYVTQNQPPERPQEDVGKVQNTLYGVLHALAKRHVIAHQGVRKRSTHGNVWLTDEQRPMWQAFVKGVRRFQTLDPEILQEYSDLADVFVRDEVKVGAALSRAVKTSILADDGTEKRAIVLAERAVAGYTGPLTVKEIVERINEQTGRTLSGQAVRTVLKSLIAQGTILQHDGRVPTYEQISKPTSTD